MRKLLPIIIASCLFTLVAPTARADDAIQYCTKGTLTLGPFAAHLAEIRKAKRYDPGQIDELIANQKAGGPDFFSTQVVVKTEQSGSGDFDLNLFQGFRDPRAKYHANGAWHCQGEDYPVAYFVGFKVTKIGDGTISVTPDKGLVNVISLKKIDPDLDKHTKVTDFQSHAVLCDDIAQGCVKTIFYGLY